MTTNKKKATNYYSGANVKNKNRNRKKAKAVKHQQFPEAKRAKH